MSRKRTDLDTSEMPIVTYGDEGDELEFDPDDPESEFSDEDDEDQPASAELIESLGFDPDGLTKSLTFVSKLCDAS